ncbi:MAG: hypothetical protein ACKOFB_05585 [bacterium]
MKFVLKTLLIVLISCLYISCGDSEDLQSKGKQIQSPTGEMVFIDTTLSQSISPTELKNCLPATFRGATKLPSSSGKVTIEGINVSKTTGEYVFPGGTITITLADYAGAVSTVLYRYELPKNQEPGMDIQSITMPNGYGYSRYSPYESTMHVYCLIDKRIAAEIIANGTETWFSDQNILTSLIPSECLVKNITSTKQ